MTNSIYSAIPPSKRRLRSKSYYMDSSDSDDSDYLTASKKGSHPPSDPSEPKPRKKAGRKMAPDEPASRRLVQNRAAQRAFRQRKEEYVHGLEAKVKELSAIVEAHVSSPTVNTPQKQSIDSLEIQALRKRVQSLEQENSFLRQLTFPIKPPAASSPVPIHSSETTSCSINLSNQVTPSLSTTSSSSSDAFFLSPPLDTTDSFAALFSQDTGSPMLPSAVNPVMDELGCSRQDIFQLW